MLEETNEEIEREIEYELQENPALERAEPTSSADEHRYYNPPPTPVRQQEAPIADPDTPTLAAHLQAQLDEITALDPKVKAAAHYIADSLDSNGYLTRTPPELAADMAIDNLTIVQQAIDTLQSLDPPGIASADLRQAILLQLKRLSPATPGLNDALEITKYFFDLYGARNFQTLAEEAQIDTESLRTADRLIASLNPKPGATFSRTYVEQAANTAVNPDFTVETDGERVTISFANSLPQLQVEQSFRLDGTPAGQDFITSRRRQAETFIDLLRRRQDTLMHIARAIIRRQSAFFTSGDDESRIRPMVLRQIADDTGLELSVVSRAVSGKWLATAWGVYPLKYFFSHRKKEEEGEQSVSTHAVMSALKDLIAGEPPSKPLSDQALADALTARGLPTARRTVTKYRQRLNIPSAHLRRKI